MRAASTFSESVSDQGDAFVLHGWCSCGSPSLSSVPSMCPVISRLLVHKLQDVVVDPDLTLEKLVCLSHVQQESPDDTNLLNSSKCNVTS